MGVDVQRYSDEWPRRFAVAASGLKRALAGVPVMGIEHVGSTSVPGLAAKPIIDIDVVVAREDVGAAIAALGRAGYRHLGDLGLADREAVEAPDQDPPRHVYVCVAGTLHLRNHLAVRQMLRSRPDLREEYGAVKIALAEDPTMDVERYLAGKTEVLGRVLEAAGLSAAERNRIAALNRPGAMGT